MTGTTGVIRFMVAALFAAVLLSGVAAPGQAFAQERPAANAAQGKASLEVVVVRADKSSQVDPSLKELQRQLGFSGFTGFKLVSEESVKLAAGQESAVAGGVGFKLKTTLLDHDGAVARARIQVLKAAESRLDTTVRLQKGKAFIVKGPKVEGGAMIYVITYE
jgi:hypothetical protein